MNKLVVSPSPHVSSEASTKKLMRDVLIALIPAFAVSVYVYGWQALHLTAVAVVSCVGFEWLISRFLLKTKSNICDLSAVLTGVLLAFNVPSGLPAWMLMIGALVSIGIAKMSFGGIGRNIFNPALVGRVFLLITFPVAMTNYTTPEVLLSSTDALSGATVLSYIKEGIKEGTPASLLMQNISLSDLLYGAKAGSLGEIGSLALLLGFIYMLVKKVISWHIPVFVLGSMAVFSGILHLANAEVFVNPMFHILSGGAMLGAIFMATDYVTSPMHTKSMIVYAIGIGIITILIRNWGAYPEGISFAILIMNSTVPLLNKYIKPKHF